MTVQLFYHSLPTKICLLLLLGNIFTACPQNKEDDYETASTKFNLGTYHLKAMLGENSEALQDFAPEYRLVSQQDAGYIVSSDTGLSLVVDGAGKIKPLDKSDQAVNEHTRVFAASDNAMWLVTATRLKHSQGQQDVAVIGDKVRVLWFSKQQILLWGEYQRPSDGGLTSGLQLYSLANDNRVKITTSISTEKIKANVATFVGAEKFIAGGVAAEQVIWLWTRESGLVVMNEIMSANKQSFLTREPKISFPRIDKVVKDIGFSLAGVTEDTIPPPAYVYAITAGDGNRGALYLAGGTK